MSMYVPTAGAGEPEGSHHAAPATPVAPDGLQPMLLPHRCPSCKIPQDRRTFCCSCNRRRKLRWCLCCGRETTKSCRWYCRKGSCPRPALQEREDLAREGYLSGPVDPGARPRLEEALGMVRQWVSGHTLSNGHPKKAVLLHHVPNQDPSTPITRYVLKPPPKINWDDFFHAVTPPAWREALISVMGPCHVTAVALPLVLPDTTPQVLHFDSRLPLYHTYNLAVQLDPRLQGPETRLVPRTHGQRWTTSPHSNFIPEDPPYFSWADRMAFAPEGALLLWDTAVIHGGPGRLPHQPARDTVLILSIDAVLSATDAAILADDAGPRPLRIRVRGREDPPPAGHPFGTAPDPTPYPGPAPPP